MSSCQCRAGRCRPAAWKTAMVLVVSLVAQPAAAMRYSISRGGASELSDLGRKRVAQPPWKDSSSAAADAVRAQGCSRSRISIQSNIRRTGIRRGHLREKLWPSAARRSADDAGRVMPLRAMIESFAIRRKVSDILVFSISLCNATPEPAAGVFDDQRCEPRPVTDTRSANPTKPLHAGELQVCL